VGYRTFVGHPGGQLVETIKNQHKPALVRHVVESVQVRPTHLGIHQVLRDQAVQVGGLLQVP
jgi:hypothetical protein